MISISLNNRSYAHPTTWDELTGAQLVAILDTLRKDWPADRQRLQLLKILTGMSAWRFWTTDVMQMDEFFYLQQFLEEQNALTKNLIPSYEGYYGPADNFGNLVVSEYIFTESHYTLYREHDSLTDLNCLIAVMYRPGKRSYDFRLNPEGDTRVPFNDNLVGYHAQYIQKWPMSIKLAILHWYEGCRNNLINQYPDIFGGGAGQPAKRGILSIAVSMAETGTFGSFEKVEKLLLHTFMIGISEQIDKAKQLPKTA